MTVAVPGNGKDHKLIEVRNLSKYYPVYGGVLRRVVANVKAVDGVSFTISQGETLGLVGESGCGKTTIGQTILGLLPHTGGEVRLDGIDIFKLRGAELKKMRRNMQIVFQDPYSSLDPRLPIGDSIAEGLTIHNIGTPQERFDVVLSRPSRRWAWKITMPCVTRTNSPAGSASASALPGR
jgi:ABC-type glutathione transport system ATPase component